MRAARYYGDREIRIDEVAAPSPGPGEVLVDVSACGICGSDLHLWAHGGAYSAEHLPTIMGHEAGGVVAEVGEGVDDVEVGTEVVVNPLVACGECWCCAEANYNLCRNLTVVGAQRPGAYAESVVAPAGNVVPLPEGITPAMAAVAEPVTVAYHGLLTSPLRPGHSALVVGTGPIGLGLVQLARAAGADPVYASGHREARRELAREFGADVVVDPREEEPGERIRADLGRGVDVAFEVAGNESALNDAIKATKPSGHATLLGVFGGEVSIDPMDLVNDERSVNASAAYETGPLADRDFGAVLGMAAAGEVDLEALVSSRIDLGDILEGGFEALADSEGEEVKVLVQP